MKRGPYMTRIAGLYVTEWEAKKISKQLNRYSVSYKFEFIGKDAYGLRVLTEHHCIAVTIVRALKG